MTSLTDFDQSGTFRTFTKQYLGPSVGWVQLPSSVLLITAPGTYQLQSGITLVEVNVAGAVTVKLPSAIQPKAGAMTLGALFGNQPITVVDIGGFAGANPITIQPFSGSEKLMGLASVQITIPYGGFTVAPYASGWDTILP